jgi:eukaryotic-like serine/threonine-protein kinase
MSNNFQVRNPIRSVGGVCRLGAVLHQSAIGSIHETEFGDDVTPALVKIRVETPDSARLVARWSNAIELAHPYLQQVYAAGYAVMDDIPIAYVIMERADESLANVLAERPLSEAETREMLAPVLAALIYLHKNGYAHCALKPSNVLAFGDVLKLSSDGVRPAVDGEKAEDDMWALGALIVEALTQEPPKMEKDSGPYILREASALFTDIVRHCLDPDPAKRWTVDQVQARLDAQAGFSASTPVEEFRARDEDQADPSRRASKAIYGVLAALILLVIVMGLWRKKEPVPQAAALQSPAAAAAPGSPLPGPSRVASNQASAEKGKSSASGVHGRRGDGWSVIVAAYIAREPAEKRDRELSRKWPNFKWSVQQQTGKARYLVVIGQNLSEEQAEALRKRAVATGLPHDTYIKKLL